LVLSSKNLAQTFSHISVLSLATVSKH